MIPPIPFLRVLCVLRGCFLCRKFVKRVGASGRTTPHHPTPNFKKVRPDAPYFSFAHTARMKSGLVPQQPPRNAAPASISWGM